MGQRVHWTADAACHGNRHQLAHGAVDAPVCKQRARGADCLLTVPETLCFFCSFGCHGYGCGRTALQPNTRSRGTCCTGYLSGIAALPPPHALDYCRCDLSPHLFYRGDMRRRKHHHGVFPRHWRHNYRDDVHHVCLDNEHAEQQIPLTSARFTGFVSTRSRFLY